MVSHGSYNTPVDIWATGIILYRMLTGHFAFVARDQEELLQRIRAAKIEVLQPYFKALDETSQAIIFKLLRKDATTRYTASEALEHEFFKEPAAAAGDAESASDDAASSDAESSDRDVLDGVTMCGDNTQEESADSETSD